MNFASVLLRVFTPARALLAVALCWLALPCSAATNDARAFTNVSENFSISLPSGWTRNTPEMPLIKFSAQSPDGTRRVALMVLPQSVPRVTPEFISGMKRGIERQGATVETERTLEVQGLPAVELTGKSSATSGRASMFVRTILAGRQTYQLIGTSPKNPDTDIVQAFESFRLLNVPSSAKAPSAAFEAGRRLGYVMSRIVIPIIVAIGLVVLILVLVLKSKKS
jgi:hypothetical protein